MSSFSRSSGFEGRGPHPRHVRWQILLAFLAPVAAAAQAPAAPADPSCPVFAPAPGAPLPAIEHVRYLADDALEGRQVGTQGERCTAAYLAARFAELGLGPAGEDGGWFQSFPVRIGSELVGPDLLEISGEAYERGKSWVPYGFSASGRVEGRLAYAGPGVAPPGGGDDAYAHVDLGGAIAVVEADWQGLSGFRADPHFRAVAAQARGAAGLLLLLPDGRALPRIEDEVRPFVRIPVAAVAGESAEAVREAARSGASGRLEAGVRPVTVEGVNVAALLPGSDPGLAEEVVVVGAHHDHLGWGGPGSLAPDARAVHNGADDNASGTAALLGIARRLLEGPPPSRSVLFLAFGGEERGLLGSSHYVENPLKPLERTVAMLNLDMVGRLEDGPLTVFGMATAEEWEALVREANEEQDRPMTLSLLPDGFGPSDHAAFYGKGIPVLHFFTGTHADYHRPTDEWHRVDGEGIERVAALTATVAARLAGTRERVAGALTPVVAAGGPHGAAPGDAPAPGYGPYFGSIPDMTPLDHGVRLTGVREGSPAALAGLREGDVIVAFGGREIDDLYAYTYALQDHAPGDRVEVVVLRDGQRITVTAVLTERR